MPTKRTKIGRDRRVQFTPELLAAYRARDPRLHALLGRSAPWLNDLYDAEGACPYPPTTFATEDWDVAVSLREALEEASK